MKFHAVNIGFWSAFILFNFALRSSVIGKITSLEIISNIWLLMVGIASCIHLRYRYQQLDFTIRVRIQLLRIIMWVSLQTALAVLAIFGGMALFTTIIDQQTPTGWPILLANYFNLFLIFLIWSLAYVFTKNYLEMQAIIVERRAISESLKTATLNTLIGQINPHFMFNTLNNIRSLILVDSEKARVMITNLSELLRYTLKPKQPNFVPLSEELNIIQDYVELCKIQHDSRLTFTKNISVDPEKYSIPPMSIQLLVENAIKHGIAQQKQGGVLTLNLWQEDQCLHIEVTNPGSLKSNTEAQSDTGLGVANIRERLRLLYHDKAKFILEGDGNFVTAKIEINL